MIGTHQPRAAMDLNVMCLYLSGYERVLDDRYRLYVDGPVPRPSTTRD